MSVYIPNLGVVARKNSLAPKRREIADVNVDVKLLAFLLIFAV